MNIAFLMGVAHETDCRALATADLDEDGKPDLLVTEALWQGTPHRMGHRLLVHLNRRWIVTIKFPASRAFATGLLAPARSTVRSAAQPGGLPESTGVSAALRRPGYFLSGLRPDRTRCLRLESATGMHRVVLGDAQRAPLAQPLHEPCAPHDKKPRVIPDQATSGR